MELKLNKLGKYSGSNGPLLLVIMDGVGFGRRRSASTNPRARENYFSAQFERNGREVE